MSYITLNSASIHYEEYGNGDPIVLIHGSTMTGHADWSHIAPQLAKQYRLIVPDCRGHGKSSNPKLSYSFKEMAGDVAALIRALGYQRAHVIGHSNGGNVALVTLLEHPDVVQACVVQAANAYVSDDIKEKEPHYFDPNRVEREQPDWMQRMIELHGATHGENYWRDLLKLTCDETITNPNYTETDLQKVSRPTLVIQGEKDFTNANSHHGEFIAQHIPQAEFWSPKGIAHHVHHDIPFEWVNKILDFLHRRGDDQNDALYRLKQDKFKDARDNIFDVRFDSGALTGFVLHRDQGDAAARAVAASLKENRVHALLDAAQWALVIRNVADVWREPDSDNRLTQTLLGDAVQILEMREDNWARVRLERDGYLGWVRSSSLYRCGEADTRAYQESANAVVVAELAHAVGDESSLRVGKIPFGVRVKAIKTQNDQSAIRLPNNHTWWVKSDDLLPLERQHHPDAKGIEATLTLMKRFVGVPYLWGGLSPFGFDCSGFSQTFHAFLGISIPRDADQQYRAGKVVEETPRAGDLLFFGVGGHITHVTLSLGGDDFIHASGGGVGVTYNSFDTKSPVFSERLKNIFVGVRRFA